MFFSALFNDEGQARLFGAAITFVFYGLDVISRMNERFSVLGKGTVFGLFRAQEVLEGEVDPGKPMVVLSGLASLWFVLSVIIFTLKDIPV